MPSIESVAGGVIIDGRQIAAKTVTGKILKQRGKYYLQLKTRKLEIPLTPLAPEAEIARMAGKDVNVALTTGSKPSVIAFGTWPTQEQSSVVKIRRWLCYIPVPDLLKKYNAAVQIDIIENIRTR